MSGTRRAAGVALGGLLLTLAAFTFAAAPLFVPGVGFLLLGTLTPLWVWLSASGCIVRRRLHAARVLEGEPVEAIVEVTSGVFGLPAGDVHDPLADGPIALRRALLAGGGRPGARVQIVARFARRGLLGLEPPAIVVSDLLGLATKKLVGADNAQEVLVLPRTEPVRWNARGRAARSEGSDLRLLDDHSATVDIDGLRPYRPGTPASRIQWAALARGAGLLERRLRSDGDTRPLVVLDARCPGSPDHLDAAVRAAGSLTLELAARGGCRILLPGERRPVVVEADLARWPGVHARLALVQSAPGTRPPAMTPRAGVGPLFYVAAQLVERLPAGIASPGAACVVVVPTPLSRKLPGSPSFEVSGCRGHVLRERSRRVQAPEPSPAGRTMA